MKALTSKEKDGKRRSNQIENLGVDFRPLFYGIVYRF